MRLEWLLHVIRCPVSYRSPRIPSAVEWTVAKVFDVYFQNLHLTANPEWANQMERWQNDPCRYCGAIAIPRPVPIMRVVSGSWIVFAVILTILIALNLHSGDIRIRPGR